ncbi:MAG: anti-sigma factor [Acidimicrobiales bacterium]
MTSHDDLQELLGVYALDALERDEAELVERHLEVCVRCRAEVAAHREVSGLLGYAGQEAPAALWDRIVASTIETPPALRMPRRASITRGVRNRPGTSRKRDFSRSGAALPPRRLAWMAAAAVLVVGILGVQVVRLNDRVSAVNRSMTAGAPTMANVQHALAEPGARKVALMDPAGHVVEADAVILPGGDGYLYGTRLAPLPPSQTYQLWGVVGNQVISYGLLGSDPSVEPFRVGAGVAGLAITAEVAGGVVSSTHAPVADGRVSTAL